ncbi:putative nicotinate-nucleotide adenylyltransferase [uncultured Paludibacter sp.]|uniref:Probable nicotinate-nucleotide adenylyltransferase n=1 Tax=uncultured Paludibacter sp. TaxID=497635 RepID=A0A653A667_9BACT|nr:putative nicotinate-nucleotide adenylyltransferase [uncultured Paludibacter sp.]
MKTIGLFFGSFNPIHLGHAQLADYIFHFSGVDEIWFIVSPKNPLKVQSELIDEHLRLKMIELATAERDYLHVSDIEFNLPKPSYTITTLKALNDEYPEDDFILLIGSDNMAIFDQWKDYRTILEDYSILVYPREGYSYEDYEEKYPEMQILEEAPLFEISSTQIREMIKNNQDASEWLHPDVYQFILENKLYQ